MSAWGDMMRRSSGQLKRKEDEYIENLKRMIRDVLSSHKVGPNADPAIKSFRIDIDNRGLIGSYTIVLAAYEHKDEHGEITRDFNSDENIEHVLKATEIGEIIKFE